LTILPLNTDRKPGGAHPCIPCHPWYICSAVMRGVATLLTIRSVTWLGFSCLTREHGPVVPPQAPKSYTQKMRMVFKLAPLSVSLIYQTFFGFGIWFPMNQPGLNLDSHTWIPARTAPESSQFARTGNQNRPAKHRFDFTPAKSDIHAIL
jgi:hypothetical protein